jgi:hypothetical protein
MWAAGDVKFGYKWLVGDGKAIKFWEDTWYGNAPLVVLYWDIYMIVNQQGKTIFELWDGLQLKCTFRRIFNYWTWGVLLFICSSCSVSIYFAATYFRLSCCLVHLVCSNYMW